MAAHGLRELTPESAALAIPEKHRSGTTTTVFRFSAKRSPRPANTNPLVNFADLSTGENGDSEAELLASNTNPGGSGWTPTMHSSKRRLRVGQILAKCLGYRAGCKALLSTKTAAQARPGRRWLPSLNPAQTFSRHRRRVFNELADAEYSCSRVNLTVPV